MGRNKENIMIKGYRHDAKEAEAMVFKAIRMAGRSMDMVAPTDNFKWDQMSEGMIIAWKQDDYNYQLMVEMEKDLVKFCQESLIGYVHELMLYND